MLVYDLDCTPLRWRIESAVERSLKGRWDGAIEYFLYLTSCFGINNWKVMGLSECSESESYIFIFADSNMRQLYCLNSNSSVSHKKSAFGAHSQY